MGRSLERQATTTTTTTASSAHASMENATPENAAPEVDQKGPEPEAVRATPSVPTSPVPDSNGDTSPPPRLASLAGLIIGQKSQQPWNSTPSESATPMSPSTTDSDQVTSYFTRPARFVDDEDTAGPRRTASFGSTVASTLNAHRRAANLAAGGSPGGSAGLTETDLRRFVFHHQRAKRLVSGLRVHAFTRQAFVSSFTVGLAIGSVVAIVLKILKDIASRMLYS